MTKEKFIESAVSKQLTTDDVRAFFSLSENEISYALTKLASLGSGYCPSVDGFPANFWETIREINSLLAMKYYVKYYICRYDDYGEFPRLGKACLTWLVNQSHDSEAVEALKCYFDKGKLSEEEQVVVLLNFDMNLWEIFCESEKQKLSSSLEERLVCLHEKDPNGWSDKLSGYIDHHKLDFPAEEMFFRSPETIGYRMCYVRKYGLSDRMRDVILVALWNVLQQNPT